MKSSVLGRRYAGALIDIGIKDGRAEQYGGQLEAAAALLGEGEVSKTLLSPLFADAFKLELIDTAVQELKLDAPVANLLRLMLEKRRLGIIGDVAAGYGDLLDQQLGRTRATVVSAVPLDGASLARLRVLMQRKIGKRVEVTTRTDPSVIGGLRVDVGSKVYDATLVNHLARLRERLKR